tara:strand:- start:3667 stop:3906 length:240 start_codon:yes stop_codon:yes gene_type:complete
MKKINKSSEELRAFICLNAKGTANGGIFIKCNIKDKIDEIEKDGLVRVVGIVYDETYDLEIMTKSVKEIEADEQLEKSN